MEARKEEASTSHPLKKSDLAAPSSRAPIRINGVGPSAHVDAHQRKDVQKLPDRAGVEAAQAFKNTKRTKDIPFTSGEGKVAKHQQGVKQPYGQEVSNEKSSASTWADEKLQ